jgi:ATP-dependent DNA helicase DinG
MFQTNRPKAHQDIETIFRTLLPRNGMAVREGQIRFATMRWTLWLMINCAERRGCRNRKDLCYLTAGALFSKYAGENIPKPILISTSSIALQNAVLNIYIPFLSDVLLEGGIIDNL